MVIWFISPTTQILCNIFSNESNENNYHVLYILALSTERPGYIDMPVATSLCSAQTLILNTALHQKEPKLLVEMADSISGIETAQDESGTSCYTGKAKKYFLTPTLEQLEQQNEVV